MKKIFFILAAGLMVSAIMIGCSTEDPWTPEPSRPLELIFVSAPDTSTAIPDNSRVSFSWTAQGGTGKGFTYQWYLSPIESAYSTAVVSTNATYENLLANSPGPDYTFNLRVTDSGSNTTVSTTSFTVSATPDVSAPTVSITEAPVEGSYVATGTSVHFTWEGDDGHENLDVIEYQYAFPTADDTSGWLLSTSATFAGVAAANPAWFYVRGQDQDNNISDWDSLSFIIKDASILYVDDYQWLDPVGNPDNNKERDQKQFYRNTLEGYAFAEWDIELQGMPDSSDLVDAGTPVYSTIVFCADSEVGTTSGTLWYEVGAYGGGVLAYYLENGGNLILTGALTIMDMTQAYPPAVLPGDFEFDWLGLDSTAWCFDYWYWFTSAIKDTATALDLPDTMILDIAKNGDQDDYAIETPGLRQEASVTNEVIFTWGPWIDPDDPPPILGSPVGHVTYFDGTPQTATLTFDTYSMPLLDIRQTFVALLTLFGE